VRTAGLFGNQGKSFVKTILERAREKKGLKVINDQISNRTYAPHLAAALGALLSTHSYGMYHVANHGACSWYEFAVEILKLAGLLATTEIVPIKSAEYESKVVRPAYSALDMLAYEQAAGRTMRHYREALREYLNS
jgi:dTDP-4-dehydrorhamnose reductase